MIVVSVTGHIHQRTETNKKLTRGRYFDTVGGSLLKLRSLRNMPAAIPAQSVIYIRNKHK